VGQFTSACSLTFYLGGAFRRDFERSSIVAKPAHNVVHRDMWSHSGSRFVAPRTEQAANSSRFPTAGSGRSTSISARMVPSIASITIEADRDPERTSSEYHREAPDSIGEQSRHIDRIAPNDVRPRRPAAPITLDGARDDELVGALKDSPH
jgi:hypothetical protein